MGKPRALPSIALAAAAGTALLIGATTASGHPAHAAKQQLSNQKLRINLNTDTDYTDPALSYYVVGWQYEYQTCVKPYTYPDRPGKNGVQIVPEAATAMPVVSNNGKTYSFNIRSGLSAFKFSPGGGPGGGTTVTAKTFAYVLDRDLRMQSGFTPFLSVVAGAKAVSAGKAKHISGVVVNGNKITIHLTAPTPDFVARLATPFLCAVPLATPVNPKGVNTVPGAGPYYIASRVPGHSIVLKRNPNYKGTRPRNFAEIDYTVGVDLDQSVLQIKRNQADYMADGLPPAQVASLYKEYGPSKGKNRQFFVYPEVEIDYVAMNTSRPLFSSVNARKAVNYAINRKFLEQTRGAFAGSLTDQILPPGMPGFQDARLYPLNGPDVAKARALGGSLNGQTAVYYTSNAGSAPLRAQAMQQFMKANLGLNLDIKQFDRATQIAKEGTKGEPFDMTDEGWVQDYPDPSDFLNILLNGESIHAANNNNIAYFNDPKYNKMMDAAAKLSGNPRYQTYGKIDVDIMKNAAPWAPYDNRNDREFFSSRVGCILFQPIYQIDLGSLCPK